MTQKHLPEEEKRALARLSASLKKDEFEDDDDQFYDPEAPLLVPPPKLEQLNEELSVEEIIARAESAEEWDIFEDIGVHLAAKGDQVKYSVKLNGEHKATVPHPCSYDWLQKKYGGGSYHVTLRSYLFSKKQGGGYLKSQSKMVANPTEEERDEDAPLPTTLGGVLPAPEKGPNSMELLGMLQTMTEKSRSEQHAELQRIREENRIREERLEREARIREERLEKEAREREAKRESEGSNTMMMLMKFMEQSSTAAREAAQRQNEMLIALLTKAPAPEKEDKRSEKMFDMLLNLMLDKKSKGESLDPIALQKLLAEARDEGYSRAQEIRALAKEEAALLAARLNPSSDGEEEEREEPKSTTKMLIETLAPVITQFAQGAQNAQAAQARAMAMPRPTQPRQLQAPRGINPNLPARPNPGTPAPGAAPAPQTAPAAGGGEHPMKEANAPKPPQRDPNDILGRTKPQQVGKSMKPSKKEIVSELVTNLIGADLSANIFSGEFNPEGTADKALLSLKDHEVDAKWLLEHFTLQDMKTTAAQKGIPDTVHPYLERFYKQIEAQLAPANAS